MQRSSYTAHNALQHAVAQRSSAQQALNSFAQASTCKRTQQRATLLQRVAKLFTL